MFPIHLSAPDIAGNERRYVQDAFDSNYVAPAGAFLERFEADTSRYTGIDHAVALSSGTAALHLALICLGVDSSDEIWTTSMTFMGGVSAIAMLNATPVFFDLEASDWTISRDLIEEQLIVAAAKNRLPRAIVTTDLYGQAVDMDPLEKLASDYGFDLVSDSAEGLGAMCNGRHAGKGARISILSFNGNKIITTSGGGMLLSDEKSIVDRARYLATQARQPVLHYEHTDIGYNYRLSNVSAAIGVGQLEMIEQKVARRRTICARYADAFLDVPGVEVMPEPVGRRSSRWLTCVTVDPAISRCGKDEVIAACTAADIEVRPLWKPMHLQPVFEGTRFVGPGLCERLFETGLCLPSGSGMSDADQDRVIGVIREALVG